jgi:LemA protein
MNTVSLVILAVVVVVILALIVMYNGLVGARNRVANAYSQIDVQLKRRYDLIPNLVETVKAYAAHEKDTLLAVTEARASVGKTQINPGDLGDPAAMEKFQQAQGALSGALSRLLVVVERYPDLKANQNFLDLQHQLEGTENRINVARQRYNLAVQTFNSSIRTFPNNLTNKFMLHLERKEPFKAEAGAEKAPKVKF